ncbi:lipoyl(octanoyl) transferase LipB [Persephonella sp.]
MLKIIDLGKTEYQEALALQNRIFERKITGKDQDNYFFITEHYPVYTAGKTTKKEHILNIQDLPVYYIDRGGSITFHGTGQIVLYPILNLKNNLSVKKYVFTLEEIIIQTLKEFRIDAYRKSKLRGVFTDKGKIASVGVKISKGVTKHGISLNVSVNKDYFTRIIPCGIQHIPVCNLTDFIPICFDLVKIKLIKHIISEGRKLI